MANTIYTPRRISSDKKLAELCPVGVTPTDSQLITITVWFVDSDKASAPEGTTVIWSTPSSVGAQSVRYWDCSTGTPTSIEIDSHTGTVTSKTNNRGIAVMAVSCTGVFILQPQVAVAGSPNTGTVLVFHNPDKFSGSYDPPIISGVVSGTIVAPSAAALLMAGNTPLAHENKRLASNLIVDPRYSTTASFTYIQNTGQNVVFILNDKLATDIPYQVQGNGTLNVQIPYHQMDYEPGALNYLKYILSSVNGAQSHCATFTATGVPFQEPDPATIATSIYNAPLFKGNNDAPLNKASFVNDKLPFEVPLKSDTIVGDLVSFTAYLNGWDTRDGQTPISSAISPVESPVVIDQAILDAGLTFYIPAHAVASFGAYNFGGTSSAGSFYAAYEINGTTGSRGYTSTMDFTGALDSTITFKLAPDNQIGVPADGTSTHTVTATIPAAADAPVTMTFTLSSTSGKAHFIDSSGAFIKSPYDVTIAPGATQCSVNLVDNVAESNVTVSATASGYKPPASAKFTFTDWNGVQSLSVRPPNPLWVYSNGYNMVEVDVDFTPCYQDPNDTSGTPITVNVDQKTLNNAVRLIDYDTGEVLTFLTTPPTPTLVTDPADPTASFTSWAQTQKANEFLTAGTTTGQASIVSTVTFYVFCKQSGKQTIRLGVQVNPNGTGASPKKYWKNGTYNFGQNGALTINTYQPIVYNTSNFQCVFAPHANGAQDDAVPDGSQNPVPTNHFYRQFNARITFSDTNNTWKTFTVTEGNTPPLTSEKKCYAYYGANGYTTYAFIWDSSAAQTQTISLPNLSDIQIDIGYDDGKSARYTLIMAFTPYCSLQADSMPTTLNFYDNYGNPCILSLANLLPNYSNLLANQAGWSPFTGGSTSKIDAVKAIQLNNQAYGVLAKTINNNTTAAAMGVSNSGFTDSFQLTYNGNLDGQGATVMVTDLSHTGMNVLYVDFTNGVFIFAGSPPSEKFKFLPVWKQSAVAIYSNGQRGYLQASSTDSRNNYKYISPYGTAPTPQDPSNSGNQSNPSDTLWFIKAV